MIKSSHKAADELLKAITVIAEVVRDPGSVRQYDEIAGYLEKARGYLANAKAYED